MLQKIVFIVRLQSMAILSPRKIPSFSLPSTSVYPAASASPGKAGGFVVAASNRILQYSCRCLMNDDEDDPDTVGYICSINFKRNGVPKCLRETAFKFE